MRNCAIAVRSHFDGVNQLIFRDQIVKIKTKPEKPNFVLQVILQLKPVFTR